MKAVKELISIKRCEALTRHALFGDLSVIDLLLQGEVTDQAVDVARLPLTVAVHATHCLGVVTRVPRCVKDDNTAGPDQIHPQTARSAEDNDI